MAYFGNTPLQSTYLTDYFSGNGSTTGFTLSRAPISSQAILVHISGVKQHASTYGVSGTTLTFSSAPPTGTNNIEVLHLGIQPETVTLPSYRTITETTATAGQTTFTPASYTVGYIDVYRNGVKLGASDFTASNGTSVVLSAACTAGDLVRFESFLITAFNNAIPNTAGAVGSSLLASGSALANIGTGGISQSYIGNGVAGTGPAFSAKAASSQSISDSTWTKINFDTELFDTNNCFSSSTFTPNVAGYYYISVIIRVGFNASWTNIGLSYRKNGSEILVPIFVQNINPLNTGSSNMFSGGGTLYFNGSSDYLEAYGYLTTGGAVREFNYASSSATSHLSGYLVRAA